MCSTTAYPQDGTSLSKAYGLIQRFSEDIDVTVFRDDLGEGASVAQLEALSGKKRRAKLDAIRDACRAYITGPLRETISDLVQHETDGSGRVEIDAADQDGQTLLVWYPEVEPRDGAYVRPAIRIESGAKSALDPNQLVTLRPYVADEADELDLTVSGVTAIKPALTFWDKLVIAHGEATSRLLNSDPPPGRDYTETLRNGLSPCSDDAFSQRHAPCINRILRHDTSIGTPVIGTSATQVVAVEERKAGRLARLAGRPLVRFPRDRRGPGPKLLSDSRKAVAAARGEQPAKPRGCMICGR
jgi:hypothetical protein